MGTEQGRPTVIGFDRGDRIVLLVGGPVVGLGIGWALPRVADWASEQRWVPFQGPLELVASWDGSAAGLAFLAVGALAGLAFALYAFWEGLSVRLTDQEVTLRAKGRDRTFARESIAGAFVDDKHLVLLGPDTHELARQKHEATAERLAAGFTERGYPWLGGDPHGAAFRRWVPDDPDLPPAAHALLRAREIALEKKQEDDVADLRGDLAKLGFVVREDKERQFWRAVPG